MAVYVEYCLFCDFCNANWFDDGEPELKPQLRRKRAKEDGWSVRKIDGEYKDLCPECEALYIRGKSLKGRWGIK